MEKKTSMTYMALGFPVIILNPRYLEFEGERVLDLNPKELMAAVFDLIPDRKGRLLGAEVRFLRSYMQLTQQAFASLIGVDHSSVAKWEAKKQEVSGMEAQVEVFGPLPEISRSHVNPMLCKGSSVREVRY